MDEPTNHLDIASKNVLKEALQSFKGTLILVSHDRDFLQGLTSTVYGFKDKEIKEYLGDIDYFLEQHKIENLREAEKKTVVKVDKVFNKKEAHQMSRAQEKELKKLNNKRSKIETEIADLEVQITEIDLELAQNYEEVSARPNFFEQYKQKKKTLDILMEDWEKLEDTISNFN
jgi:ATP-binding cassette subfamily F protein 3